MQTKLKTDMNLEQRADSRQFNVSVCYIVCHYSYSCLTMTLCLCRLLERNLLGRKTQIST